MSLVGLIGVGNVVGRFFPTGLGDRVGRRRLFGVADICRRRVLYYLGIVIRHDPAGVVRADVWNERLGQE